MISSELYSETVLRNGRQCRSVYLNVPRRRPNCSRGTELDLGAGKPKRGAPAGAPLFPGWRRSSEGDDALDHEALELATAADVARREGLVVLADELELREHVRGDEPATADLGALDRDVVGDAGELAIHCVVAATDVELVAGEAVESLAHELAQRTPGRLAGCGAGHRLDVSEELDATDLHEGVEHEGRDVVPHARLDRARPRVGRLARAGRLDHAVVPGAGAVAAGERAARGAVLLIEGAGEPNPHVGAELLVDADLGQVRRAALPGLLDHPLHL